MNGHDLGLDDVLTPHRDAPGHFRAHVPEGWRQGRGAFGGLVLGLLTRAAEEAAEGRALRSLTAVICGPTAAGEADIALETLRAGTGVTTVTARLVQGGEVQAHGTFVLGRVRARDLDGQHVAPPSPPPFEEAVPLPGQTRGAAEFSRFFEYRNTGPWPFSGTAEALASGWLRPRRACARRDAAWLVACADAWWPAALAGLDAPRPMATIAFTFEQVGDLDQEPLDASVYHRARALAGRDGYVVEERELWSASGRLLAINHQTLVLIR